MPAIVDYPAVLKQLESEGLSCRYFNGGAFGFDKDIPSEKRGWIGAPDGTIRHEMRPFFRDFNPPYATNLAAGALRAWNQIGGNVWGMPASHWSFELGHANGHWLPKLLAEIGIESTDLEGRTNAAAIEFHPGEDAPFESFVQGLLEGLSVSDFTLAFPGHQTVCMLHHHKQLWWTTANHAIADALDAIR